MKATEGVITISSKPPLDGTSKKFNKVKFTMELWQEDAKMPSLFNNLLYKGPLGPEVRLALQDFLCATA